MPALEPTMECTTLFTSDTRGISGQNAAEQLTQQQPQVYNHVCTIHDPDYDRYCETVDLIDGSAKICPFYSNYDASSDQSEPPPMKSGGFEPRVQSVGISESFLTTSCELLLPGYIPELISTAPSSQSNLLRSPAVPQYSGDTPSDPAEAPRHESLDAQEIASEFHDNKNGPNSNPPR